MTTTNPGPTPAAALVALHRMSQDWKLNAQDISIVNDALLAAKAAAEAAKEGEPIDFMDPEDLTKVADQIGHQRGLLMSAYADGVEADTEQYILIASAHLYQAEAHFKLAALCQSRALSAARGVR